MHERKTGCEEQAGLIVVPDAVDTERLGADYAQWIRAPMIVYLSGPLGGGKTTFSRGFLRALGYRGKVKSPTYTLLETYDIETDGAARVRVLHLDLYRIGTPGELIGYGLRECFDEDAIVLVEWPEHGVPLIPQADVHLRFEYDNDSRNNSRLVRVIKSPDKAP